MGYRISYGQAQIREEIPDKPEGKIPKWVISTLVVVAAVIIGIYMIGPIRLLEFMLPGDPAVTHSALESFADNIRDGERLGTAVTTFCQEIIDGAQLPE